MAGRSPTVNQEAGHSSAADSELEPEVFCKLCLSQQPTAASRELQSCRCMFCTACLQQYVQLAIMEGGGAPITCPDMACQKSGVLLDSEISSLAAAEQVELYQRLKFERGVKLDPSKAWCPVLECQAVCSVQPSTEGQPGAVACPTCQTVFCSGCRGLWQDGHACPEQQPMILSSLSNGSSDADVSIKQCPMCGIYIERNQGCAQMLCKSCKHTFCWYCLENLDVVGILVGVSIIVLVTSPLLLLASPCILCCMCKPCSSKKKKKKKQQKKKDVSQPDRSTS
ncbi:E3 ubiquitin-protein ligase RNF144B isoform X2 [Kryptolebias marmoratus]|uniref:E3 ubiquitin-protein ligase RNF144B isoform X2 n=1 Tax=Kryptolebias marmoratus TaxID=37003 RepID=UPI000D531210|nr:E3 ubiquitin-protein ligase RNF144B isoform X2 [Kryptolebias marmoratus]